MCDLFDCYDCRHKCRYNATDRDVEELWNELSEEQKKNEKLKTGITITGTSSAIFLVLMVVFIFI